MYIKVFSCRKYFLTAIFIVFSSINVFSQNDDFTGETTGILDLKVNNTSPNAHGTANLSIPLWTIQEGEIEVPIALNYTQSGIRVNDIASLVGLGWNLSQGGVISRELRDLPDDHSTEMISLKARGWWDSFAIERYRGWVDDLSRPDNPSNLIGQFPFIDEEVINYDLGGWYINPSDFSSSEEDIAALWSIRALDATEVYNHAGQTYTEILDKEPDIYSINLPTLNVQFTFDHDGEIGLVNQFKNIKVEYHKDDIFGESTKYRYADYVLLNDTLINTNYNFTSIDSLTITDEDGTIYEFGVYEKSYRKFDVAYWPRDRLSIGDNDEFTMPSTRVPYVSKWFLSKITDPLGNQVSFIYEDETQVFENLRMQRRFECKDDTDLTSCSTLRRDAYTKFQTDSIETKRLSKIITRTHEIEFIESQNDRLDLQGSKSLDYIIVKSLISDEQLNKFSFHYTYSLSDTTQSLDIDYYDFSNSYSTRINEPKNRLFLDKVTVQGLAGTGEFTLWDFDYDQTKLPNRFSSSQDFWGYYNNNGSKYYFPKLYVYPNETGANRYRLFPITNYSGTYYELVGEDRTVDETAIKAGILTKVTNRFGGYVEYEYEPNTFYDEGYGSEIMGGGLRLKKVKEFDGESYITRRFEYLKKAGTEDISSGMITQYPVFATETGTMDMEPDTLYKYFWCWTVENTDCDDYEDDIYISSQPTEYGIVKKFYSEVDYRVLHPTLPIDPLLLPDTLLGSVNTSPFELWDKFTIRFSNPINYEPSQVFYTNIREVFSDESFRETEYYPVKSYKNNASFVNQTENHGYLLPFNDRVSGCGTFVSIDSTLSGPHIQRTGYNIFPYPRFSADTIFTYGKIKSIKEYNSASVLQSEMQYDYQTYSKSEDFHSVKGLNYSFQNTECIKSEYYGYNSKYSYHTDHNFNTKYSIPYVWATYTMYLDADAFPSQITKRIYDQNGTNSLTTIVENDYEITGKSLLTKRTETNSNNESRVTEYKYAHEIYDGTDEMEDRNMLTQPYSVTIKDGDGQILNKTWTLWEEWGDGQWLPCGKWAWDEDIIGPPASCLSN